MLKRLVAVIAGAMTVVTLHLPTANADTITRPRGAVVKVEQLPTSRWIPGTRAAYKLTYVTSNTFGQKAYSTGTVFIPRGTAPVGGWPVVSWAHGTSGIADACAPSRTGPSLPERDFAYLGTWMKQGYAIVASDYAGLGTPGLHAYLDGKTAAHNIVDMVTAGRGFASSRLPASMRLARKWVTIGQSQGGGASIYTARYATQYSGTALSYRGAVGTGTPANIEKLLLALGPKVPPVPALPQGITSYVAYIMASLEYARPALGIGKALTPTGREFVEKAKRLCVMDLEKAVAGANVGDWFNRPLALMPGYASTLREYMAMPESGFDKPFFMGHGLLDTDVPIVATLPYVAVLTLNRQPVTFRTYPTDHSGTMLASLPDSVPFVARLMR
ncbi:lipase family protein [Nocardioides sp.]|uniref:lipase family protein n=1 Tax=Nocardioides sp. TaxID=35761 RepID=UPI002BD5CED6|nr:lipase family protein [Nocardioides sp.]HSX69250.1 lipase family protein [Nocardioides sp.]